VTDFETVLQFEPGHKEAVENLKLLHEKTPEWLEKEVVSLRDRNQVLSDAVSKLEAEVKELRQFKFESTKTL
jgi:hypothetical protein